MAMGLLRREDEEDFFSGPGRGKPRGQMIESKIASLQDMATKVMSNRRSCRWLNDRLLIELVPPLHLHDIKPLFTPPPWGDELPLSAFCMTGAAEWDVFRIIDMDLQTRLMQLHMTRSSSTEQKKSRVDQDEIIALNAWHRVDRQTREAMKRNFLPNLLVIYEERVRAFIQDTSDNKLDVLVLDVQDPFQRLLLHGVCEFYNVASVTISTTVRGGGNKQWKTKTIKKRLGTGVPSKITLVSFLTRKKNGSL